MNRRELYQIVHIPVLELISEIVLVKLKFRQGRAEESEEQERNGRVLVVLVGNLFVPKFVKMVSLRHQLLTILIPLKA